MHNPYENSETLLLRELMAVPPPSTADPGAGASSHAARSAASAAAAALLDDDDDAGRDDEAAATAELHARGVSVEVALDRLFPPAAAGAVDGVESQRVASRGHVDRMDVIHLQEQLDARCRIAGARPLGVCPIREGLYGDALDELIRQATVLCPERGELLGMLRDEVRETNATYDLLFEASCQYAVRKAIERDLKRTMQAQLGDLELETGILQNRVNELRAKRDGIKKRFEERRAAEDKKHQEEVLFLKKGNQQLTQEIKRLTS